MKIDQITIEFTADTSRLKKGLQHAREIAIASEAGQEMERRLLAVQATKDYDLEQLRHIRNLLEKIG